MVIKQSFPLQLGELIHFLARIYLTGRLGGLSHLNIYIEPSSPDFVFAHCNCLLTSNSEWRLNLQKIFPDTCVFYKSCSILELTRLWDSMKSQLSDLNTESKIVSMQQEVLMWLSQVKEEI